MPNKGGKREKKEEKKRGGETGVRRENMKSMKRNRKEKQ